MEYLLQWLQTLKHTSSNPLYNWSQTSQMALFNKHLLSSCYVSGTVLGANSAFGLVGHPAYQGLVKRPLWERLPLLSLAHKGLPTCCPPTCSSEETTRVGLLDPEPSRTQSRQHTICAILLHGP